MCISSSTTSEPIATLNAYEAQFRLAQRELAARDDGAIRSLELHGHPQRMGCALQNDFDTGIEAGVRGLDVRGPKLDRRVVRTVE